jgi:hypothetical protein
VSAGDEGVLLDLFVVVAGTLLGVGVGGDPGEGEDELVRHCGRRSTVELAGLLGVGGAVDDRRGA